LESELDLFRASEGLDGARSSLAGLLGEPLPSSSGFLSFFPHTSEAQNVEGINPFVGLEDRHPTSGGGLESFLVG